MKMAANAIPRTMTRGKLERVALVAVLGGATGIGFAPILVRLSETGPSATAGLRVLFALPLLWMMANVQRRKQPSAVQPTSRRDFIMLAVAGLFFTADLSIWHWSLRFTSVANSPLLTNFPPVFVAIGPGAAGRLHRRRLFAALHISHHPEQRQREQDPKAGRRAGPGLAQAHQDRREPDARGTA